VSQHPSVSHSAEPHALILAAAAFSNSRCVCACSYTAVGDVVDSANKMEEINKEFGTYIAVTRAMYLRVRRHPERRRASMRATRC